MSAMERLRSLAGEMIARDSWSRPQLVEYQRARLKALLKHACAHSEYYRQLLGADAAAGDIPLEQLSILTKGHTP